MNLLLVRHAYLPDVTLGWLYADALRLATLEEPWHADPDGPGGQKRDVNQAESCVPDGVYTLHPHSGTKFTNVWCLVNPALGVYREPGDIPTGQTWGRAAVLIHRGNTTADILGCIVVGLRHGRLDGKDAVLESHVALDQLRVALEPGTHQLEIRSTHGTEET